MEYASSVKGITQALKGEILEVSYLLVYADAENRGGSGGITKCSPSDPATPAPVFQLVVDATGDRVFGFLFFMGFYSICTFISVHCSGCSDRIRIDPLHPGIV